MQAEVHVTSSGSSRLGGRGAPRSRALWGAMASMVLAACGGGASVSSGGAMAGTSGGSGRSSASSASSGSSGGSSGGSTGTSGTSGASSAGTSGTSSSSICDTQSCVVYASADHDLYQVDPQTLTESHLCAFGGALTSTDVVTDIAVENQGTVYAITEKALYTVNPQTCAATEVATLSQSGTRWVGLTFTASGQLLAADGSGNVVTINPGSGAITPAGSFGGLVCSGDLVAINDAAGTIYATASDPSCSTCNDKLVTLNPSTHAATVIGDVGHRSVFGLGYWGGKLYGFSHGGLTLQINPATGASTVINTSNPTVAFSGGATTPLAPVFQ